jgi:hypothetical protein
MSITTDRIAKANGIGRGKTPLDAVAKSHLFDALVGTLDNIAIGIVIVAEQGRIMHANHAAREMLAAKSPIMALGNCLCALQSERTKELRQAIATAQTDPASISPSGIGVPLIDKSMNAATAHVLALVSPTNQAQPLNMQAPVAVFVTPPSIVPPIETGAVARLFKLTPAEARLLAQLVSGASLAEAALNLGMTHIGDRSAHGGSGLCRTATDREHSGTIRPPKLHDGIADPYFGMAGGLGRFRAVRYLSRDPEQRFEVPTFVVMRLIISIPPLNLRIVCSAISRSNGNMTSPDRVTRPAWAATWTESKRHFHRSKLRAR